MKIEALARTGLAYRSFTVRNGEYVVAQSFKSQADAERILRERVANLEAAGR